MFDDVTGGDIDDPRAQALFHEAYFHKGSDYSPEERAAIRDELSNYLLNEYGIDFDDAFDWDTWRETYAAA